MLARDEDILKAAEDWRREGRGVALATVVETWGSAPRPVGSNLVIDDQGNGVGPACAGQKFGCVDLNTFGSHTIGGPLTQGIFRFDPLLPAYNLVNLRVGLTRQTWELSVYLNNALDEIAFLALDRERGTRARVGYLTNQPRTVGVAMRFDY